MNLHGSDKLWAMRKAGERPVSVWIDFGPGRVLDWFGHFSPHLRVLPNDPIERLDLRCLIDLDLYFQPDEWTDRAASFYERLQEYARTIHVVSMCFEPEMGWCWHRDYGRRELGELHFVDDLKEAQAECSLWAQRKNEAKYQQSQQREMKILEAAPWLIS